MEKLTHQPYEDWLLEAAALPQDEAGLLQEHLFECEACLRLSNALKGMEMELRTAPVVAPAPGFGQRWQARLHTQELQRKRRQTLISMVVSVGGAMMLFALLLLAAIPLLRMPVSAVVISIFELARALTVVSAIGEAVTTVFSVAFNLVPRTMWIAICVALGALSTLWIVALQQLTSARRVEL